MGAVPIGSLVGSIDGQVRAAAVLGHRTMLQTMGTVGTVQVAGLDVPAAAALPSETLAVRRVKLSFDLRMFDDGVKLGCRVGGCPGKLVMEWEATAAPEATALLRTRAELTVAKE